MHRSATKFTFLGICEKCRPNPLICQLYTAGAGTTTSQEGHETTNMQQRIILGEEKKEHQDGKGVQTFLHD
jgi:hypothetical protein